MISRIAEQSFWMFRYLEREEILAHSFLSTHLFGLDSHTPAFNDAFQLSIPRERPLFLQIYNGHDTDEELIQYFRVWQELNPDSLLTLQGAARANALLIREVISESMWQMINKLYLWLHHETTKSMYMTERYSFYTRIIETIQHIKGNFYNSLLRDEYYHIMSIGIMIERLSQIMLMLDKLNSKEFLQSDGSHESAREQSNLLSCLLDGFGATQNYLRRDNDFKLSSFIEFFLKDSLSPYTMAYALKKCTEHLTILQSELTDSNLPLSLIQELSNFLSNVTPEAFLTDQGSNEKHQIFLRLNKINEELQRNIFSMEKTLV